MFDLRIISQKRVLFDDAVESVRADGDDSEYEILSFHAMLVGILREGDIIINDRISVPVKKGIIRFLNNRCTILIEEPVGTGEA